MASLIKWAKDREKNVQNIARGIGHAAQASVAQVNPLDGGRTYNTVRQQGAQYAPRPQQSAVNQVTHNGVTNATGSFLNNIAGVSSAIDAGRLGVAELTHNQHAIDNSTISLAKNLPRFMPVAMAESFKNGFGQDIATAATAPFAERAARQQQEYAQKTLNNHTGDRVHDSAVNAYSQAVKTDLLNQHLHTGGIDMNTSKSQVIKHVGGNAASTAANLVLLSKLPAAFKAEQAAKLAKTTGTTSKVAAPSIKKQALAFGGLNATAGVADTATNPNATGLDYVKAGGLGFVTGAALPLGIHAAPTVLRGAKTTGKVANDNLNLGRVTARRQQQEDFVVSLNEGISKATVKGDKATARKLIAQRTSEGQKLERLKKQESLLKTNIGLATQAVDENGQPISSFRSKNRANKTVSSEATIPVTPQPLQVAKPVTQPTLLAEPPMPPIKTSAVAPPVKPPKGQLVGAAGMEPNPNVPAPLGPTKTSTFAGKTVPQSETVSKGIKQRLNAPEYSVQQEKANYTASLSRLKNQGNDQFITSAETALDKPHGTISRQEATDAITAAQILDGSTDPAALNRASAIYDKLSSHYTAAGQLTQSAAILSRRTPQGLLYGAERELRRVGATITPELSSKLRSAVEEFKKAPQAQKETAAGKVGKLVADNTPQTAADKLTSVWKAGLLSGVKTQQGNFLSNATFAGLKKVSDIPATAVDTGLSLITGKRTKTLTLRGATSGTVQGIKEGSGTLRTGLDKRNIVGGKYEQHGELNFKNPIINTVFGKPTNFVFRAMSAADQPFYYSAAKNSLYDQAKASAKNIGLHGKEADAYVAKMVDNPSTSMAERARADADKAVLGYDTVASKIINGAHNVIDKMDISPAGRATAHVVLHAIAPFVKVPSAFISRTVDFTPAGPFKEAISQISKKQFDQRALSQSIGEGLTGTGALALGIALSQHQLISGDYPKADPKEAQRWKAEGITPNSVKIYRGKDQNGKPRYQWISLNYMGPLGLLFNAGHQIENAKDQGTVGKIAASVGGLGQGLMGQSFLQGFSGLSDAITNPEQNAKNYINSQVASGVPAWVNDLANVTDKYQRQADTLGEAVKNRIPVLRKDNKIKQDVYGNNLAQAGGQLNTLNGVKPSNNMTNKSAAVSEVNRLHNIDPNNPDLQVTPVALKKTISVEGNQVQLTDQQRYDLQKKVGQLTQENWNKLIQTPQYKALDDISKAQALSKLRTDSTTVATRTYVTDNNIAEYNKANTKKVSNLMEGSANLTDYTKSSGKGTSTSSSTATPADKYKTALDNYNTNKGTMSDAKKYSTESTLSRLKVNADYSSDVVDLYKLSKDKLNQYLSTPTAGVDKKALADQLNAYDQALYNSGQTKYRKYKNGFASASGSKGSKKSGRKTARSKSTRTGKTGASLAVLQKGNVKSPTFKKVVARSTPSFKAGTRRSFTPKKIAVSGGTSLQKLLSAA